MSKSELDPPFARLVELIESNLFLIANSELTREQAIDIKSRFQRPLGVLNSRHGLASNARGRERVVDGTGKKH